MNIGGYVCRTGVTLMLIGAFAPGHAFAASAPARAARVTQTQTTPEGVSYSFTTGPDESSVLTADAGDLHLEKTVSPEGATELVLRSGADEVRIALNAEGVTVWADHRQIDLRMGRAGSDQAEPARKARIALANSHAVQAFRVLAAAMGERDPATPFDHALLLSAALVAQLAGDPAALRNHAREQAGRARARAGVRPVRLSAPITDCWGQYEQYMLWAYYQYLQCLTDAGVGLRIWGVKWCDIQYMMRAESGWFQFISCSTIPLK